MELWNQLVNTAMIGTGNQMPTVSNLPEYFSEAATILLQKQDIDSEEKFLQIASLAMNYRQCGVAPINNQEATIPLCEAEEKQYANNASLQVLKDILVVDNFALLHLWLRLCNKKQQIVTPQLLPTLLLKGAEKKDTWNLVLSCCGNRGRWLAGYHEQWSAQETQTTTDIWGTGTPAQRSAYLKEQRQQDATNARALLQQTWPVEDAATKLLFLEAISETISEADIVFLESLSAEKSKKVKEEAKQLLKRIPTSAIVLRLTDLLSKTVSIKKEKGLLGIGNKTTLLFQLPTSIEKTIWESGIEKLSSSKSFTDDEYIVFQLIEAVPPSFWQLHLNETTSDIIGYFQKSAFGKKMLPALATAAVQFQDEAWAKLLWKQQDEFFINLLPLLPSEEQTSICITYFDAYPAQLLTYVLEQNKEWSPELAVKIMKYIASNPYQYNRGFYNEYIRQIPVNMAPLLEKITPKEPHFIGTWNTIKEHIHQLIQLKSQTIQSFH